MAMTATLSRSMVLRSSSTSKMAFDSAPAGTWPFCTARATASCAPRVNRPIVLTSVEAVFEKERTRDQMARGRCLIAKAEILAANVGELRYRTAGMSDDD